MKCPSKWRKIKPPLTDVVQLSLTNRFFPNKCLLNNNFSHRSTLESDSRTCSYWGTCIVNHQILIFPGKQQKLEVLGQITRFCMTRVNPTANETSTHLILQDKPLHTLTSTSSPILQQAFKPKPQIVSKKKLPTNGLLCLCFFSYCSNRPLFPKVKK